MSDIQGQQSKDGLCENEEPAILFFDVDGTITWFDPTSGSDKTPNSIRPSKGVTAAFARLRELGHRAFICTGRPLSLIPPVLRNLNPAGIVAGAGAALEIDGELIYSIDYDADMRDEFVRRVWDAGDMQVIFESNGGSLTLTPEGMEDPLIPGIPITHSPADIRALDVCKVCMNAVDLDRLRAVEGGATFFDGKFESFDTGGGRVELSPKGIDKGYGVRRAMEHFGYEGNEHSFGFGDSGNDLAMLEAVETSVAMGNAMPEVKAVATYITDDVQDDGVVTAMKHFGLL